MATTTNYSWTTPDDTALVKDGAAAIRSLGTAIDSTVFTNAGNAIAKTIVDAKGDLIVATAADTVARLAVGGTNGHVLQVDSSTASGLKWDSVAAGGMTLISTTTLTGASVTLSSIPATYNDLKVIIRNYKPANDGVILRMRFNGDSGANRYFGRDFGTAGVNAFDSTQFNIGVANDNSTATGLTVITVDDYANAVTMKMANAFNIGNNASTPTDLETSFRLGVYNQTAAISSIVLYPSSGNFTSGEVLLYGVK
jgi:hypothetical protein